MAGQYPAVTAREVVRALARDGWEPKRQSGSHLVLQHATKRGTVTVPMHAGRTLKRGTLRQVLNQAGLSLDQFRRLL